MNKREFDTKRQLLWVYLRNQGCCAACGGEVNPREVATDTEIASPLPTDVLLTVRLLHPFCKAARGRGAADRPVPRAA